MDLFFFRAKQNVNKPVRKGLHLGKKVTANTLMEQLEKEGETIESPSRQAREEQQQQAALEPYTFFFLSRAL